MKGGPIPVLSAAVLLLAGLAADGRADTVRTPGSLPILTRESPYGSPLVFTAPSAPLQLPPDLPVLAGTAAEPRLLADGEEAGALRGRAALPLSPKASLPGRGSAFPAGADLAPPPGTFRPEPVAIPDPTPMIEKRRALGPHLSPDAEVRMGRSMSMGVFGGVEGVDLRNSTGMIPSIRARDVGAGLTLQYRFGQ